MAASWFFFVLLHLEREKENQPQCRKWQKHSSGVRKPPWHINNFAWKQEPKDASINGDKAAIE